MPDPTTPSRIGGARGEPATAADTISAADIRRRFIDFFVARGHEYVPSMSLVPGGDQTLLFTNSGMVQFKDVFTGRETRSYRRAVNSQRCLRVAGKHNDFEEVGRTPRHHTLFEMLGNWSFGDYFKREAIHWAWEFLTANLGIPAARLAATVYTDDAESYAIWHDEIGLPPERIGRWGNVDAGDDKNFWRMAETGPCGPCSEIHYDRGIEFSEGPDCTPDHSETCPRWLEIWNNVFMEFDQQPDGSRPYLPFKSVDTGMGLERLASVVQQVPTNYDTDLFTPIHARMRELLGHDPDAFEAERFSYQVIADHSRAITFLVADGVLPTNEGRGYVLRRILRRAARHGRLLGRHEPFLAETAAVVIDLMSDAYPYLIGERNRVLDVIRREEEHFARTLDAGTVHLEQALRALGAADDATRVVGRRHETLPVGAPLLDGAVAFRLHDTYGFPIDLTVDMAAEYGVRVDRVGFDGALAEQRTRSRAGAKGELSRLAREANLWESILRRTGDPVFLGYDVTEATGTIVSIVRGGIEYEDLSGEGEAAIVLDRTPFYAESGGQIGDRGTFLADGVPVFEIVDTQKPIGQLVVHLGTLARALRVGQSVTAVVDGHRRAGTMRNHTATHLLHRALRNTVGPDARQAGSLVTPDHLRFDFPFDRALTDEEKRRVEGEVRRVVREDRPVATTTTTMAEAIGLGADAIFDEKYGEVVRLVQVRDYSRELCGGTHCRASGEIGGFFITGERSIGAGLRRIEAVTGEAADEFVAGRFDLLGATVEALGATDPATLPARVAELQARVKDLERRIRQGMGPGGPARPRDLADRAERIDGVPLVAYAGPFESQDELKARARDVRGLLETGVVALVMDSDEPIVFVTVSDDLAARGVSAADLVLAAVNPIAGRGGGRPAMAQGRGTRRAGIPDALDAIRRGVAAAAARWSASRGDGEAVAPEAGAAPASMGGGAS